MSETKDHCGTAMWPCGTWVQENKRIILWKIKGMVTFATCPKDHYSSHDRVSVICFRIIWKIQTPFPNLQVYANHNVNEIGFIWTANLSKASTTNPDLPLSLCKPLGLLDGLQKFRSEQLSQHQYQMKNSNILSLVWAII